MEQPQILKTNLDQKELIKPIEDKLSLMTHSIANDYENEEI